MSHKSSAVNTGTRAMPTPKAGPLGERPTESLRQLVQFFGQSLNFSVGAGCRGTSFPPDKA
jgi:hypothetical protein